MVLRSAAGAVVDLPAAREEHSKQPCPVMSRVFCWMEFMETASGLGGFEQRRIGVALRAWCKGGMSEKFSDLPADSRVPRLDRGQSP